MIPKISSLVFLSCVISASLVVCVSQESLAADQLPCATVSEAQAFQVRNLQSQFMVAALACNQREAYTKFVKRFRPFLVSAGDHLVNYFERIGKGPSAINQHVTDLANAAGLERAARPSVYCSKTWELFWELEQTPLNLVKAAAENHIDSVSSPSACRAQQKDQSATRTPSLN